MKIFRPVAAILLICAVQGAGEVFTEALTFVSKQREPEPLFLLISEK